MKDMILDHNNRISELEENYRGLFHDTAEIEKRLKEIERFQDLINKPYKCPICEGTTFCKEGMLCVPCDGNGIVWEPWPSKEVSDYIDNTKNKIKKITDEINEILDNRTTQFPNCS